LKNTFVRDRITAGQLTYHLRRVGVDRLAALPPSHIFLFCHIATDFSFNSEYNPKYGRCENIVL
jgi:hypothetical protein